MNRMIKLAMPALALGMFALVPNVIVKADDAPPAATQPSKATGSVTVKVVDGDGKPVVGATVTINPPAAPGAAATPRGRGTPRPKPLATGTTDANGLATLKDVPVGDYTVNARMTNAGNGRAKVTIAAEAPADAAPTTITLKPRTAGGGGAGGAGGGAGNGNAGNGNGNGN